MEEKSKGEELAEQGRKLSGGNFMDSFQARWQERLLDSMGNGGKEPGDENKMDKIIERLMTIEVVKSIRGGGGNGGGSESRSDKLFDLYMLKMIKDDGNGKTDPILQKLMEKAIEGNDRGDDKILELIQGDLKDQREKFDDLQDTMTANEKKLMEEKLDAMQAQMEAMASEKYNTPPPPPKEKTIWDSVQDDLNHEMGSMMSGVIKEALQKRLGIDMDKPAKGAPASTLDTVNEIVKSITNAMSQGMDAFGRYQAAQSGIAQPPPQQLPPQEQQMPQMQEALPPQAMQYVAPDGAVLDEKTALEKIRSGELVPQVDESAPSE